MTEQLLISETKLRTFSDINNSLDSDLIRNNIRIAQDFYLQAILGTKLYWKLLEDVQAGTVAGVYKTLLDQYVQDYLLYCTYYETLESVYVRVRNNGLLNSTGGDNSQSVDLTLYNQKRQSVQTKMNYYGERLTNYLLEEEALYPELDTNNKLYEQDPDYSSKYKNPFVMRQTAGAAAANDWGIPVYDKRLKQYPQNYWGYGKQNNLPK